MVRQLVPALSAVFLSVGLALAVFFAAPQGSKAVSEEPAASSQAEQYHGEDSGVESPRSGAVPNLEVPASEFRSPGGGPEVSEGSVAEARAPVEVISEMEPARPYSQVVDNSSRRRFVARGWEENRGSARREVTGYNYIQPASEATPARYRVKIPTEGKYTVYARWPAARGNNVASRFGVSTPSGIRWTSVNQRRDGGMWMRIGEYRLERGDRWTVQVSGHSKGEGRVVADAVMVVRGTQTTPPGADDAPRRTSGEPGTGHDVVREARTHIGTPYRHSPPEPCQPHRSEDCSCLTSIVFDWVEMPDNPTEQWGYGREVARSELRPGDLVFFKEGGSSIITHVAIYSGNGNIVHASSYWGRVVERELRYVDGYYGARRLTG
jgi:cell wall-associated NlpC family hydrolase